MLTNDVIQRIQKIYNSCAASERPYLKQMLEEFAISGRSTTYENAWLADYKEIPVDIDTFLTSDTYLGKTNRHGEGVFPHWRQVYRDIFYAGNKYQEVVLSGATRIGKTTTAVGGAAYMLYRLMCLRDPQRFFGKKEISKFSILFFNITKDAARGVAFREFNDTLKESPWFCAHGAFSKSERDFYYIPEGGKIDIDYGSDSSHGLGKQIFCLVGDTQILTDSGYRTLEDLANQSVASVGQYTGTGIQYSECNVVRTKYADETIRITLEDGSTIEGTPEHPVLLSDGTYKPLGELSEDDDILTLNIDFDKYAKYSNLRGRIPRGCMKTAKIERIHHDTPVPVYDVVDARPYHNFIVRSNSGIVAHNCAIMDECNFARAGVKDVNKAKEHMKSTYNTVVARVNGTFRMDGEVWGKVFAVSSKNNDSDFMEDYVETQLNSGAGDHLYVDSKPQWEVFPPSMFKGKKFYIAVGDRHKRGFVVPDNQTFPEALEELRSQGYTLMTPPEEMRSDFVADFEIALRDLAGIAVPGMLSFITQESLTACIKQRKNPFYSDTLEIGTKDALTIQEFCHLDLIDPLYKRCPMTIHLDLSLDVCRTGISGIWAVGRKDMSDGTGRIVSMPTFAHAFSIALQAPRGDKIPYAKITEFLCWLRKQGLNITSISRDQYQSEYMAQLLEAQGFDSPKISLDRTPDAYEGARSIILEERIDLLDVQLLQDELIHLQRDSLSGRIEKPIGGSKDVADSFAGALWNAIELNPGVPVAARTVASAIAAVNGGRGGGQMRPTSNSNHRSSSPYGVMANINRKR